MVPFQKVLIGVIEGTVMLILGSMRKIIPRHLKDPILVPFQRKRTGLAREIVTLVEGKQMFGVKFSPFEAMFIENYFIYVIC